MTPRQRTLFFAAHILCFVLAACLVGLGANGSGWAFLAAAASLLLSGVFALIGGRTFLTAQTTRLSIAKRADDPAELAAAERAAATWTGVVLVALGGLLLYLAATAG
ncbi:MAG: hypothetical protein GXP55_14900 [Deltaproteobacteria bacterium]|nr:hypothetical protein [Deltaproteobacteria bacterium]